MPAKRSLSKQKTSLTMAITPPAEPTTKGERTRAVLLDAAKRLFVSQGFHGTSMRAIADEAGLALGGIYNHFGSKEDIFVAILAERHPFLIVLPAIQSAQGATVEVLVRDAAGRMIAELSQNQEFLNLLLIELVEFEAKHIPMMFDTLFPPLMEFAQRFQAVHGPLREIPLPIILRSFIGLFFSYFITDLLIGNLLPAEMKSGAFDYFIDIYLHGILAGE
ncbi:HTH-type transcriptional repressor KstR2 [Thermoflexales bacterium]|nr:HTH-type transcriptional repressor KstR2 [Thermoflexales bacterium]